MLGNIQNTFRCRDTVSRTTALAAALVIGMASTAQAGSIVDMAFHDDFESYATGDIKPSGMPIGHPDRDNPDTPWAGAAAHFGKIVNIDDESIRGNTPNSRFGDQVLKFDNPYASGSAHAQTIDQASRAFNSTMVGLDYNLPLHVEFDIRSIEDSQGTVSAEINIGLARAGRLIFTNHTGGNGLRAVLIGGDGFQNPGGSLTNEFISDELDMGEWYRISYGLDVANDLYTFIDIDGQRSDNNGLGWNAGVNRFGDDIQHIHLIQDAGNADFGGIYLDNVNAYAVPSPAAATVGFALLAGMGLTRQRGRRKQPVPN